MIDFLKKNSQLVLMILTWVACGNILTELAMGVVVITVLLLKRKNMYMEMILGFMIILMFSDSTMPSLLFAQKIKDIYLVLLTLFIFFDWKKFSQRNIMFVSFLPFIIWAMLILVNSPILSKAFEKTISYGLLFLVTPLYFGKVIETRGTDFLKAYIWVLVFILISGVLVYFFQPDTGMLGSRFRGINRNPNGMGIFCLMSTFVVAVFTIKNPGLLNRTQILLIYALIFICMFFSGSRNSLLSAIIFFMFVHFYRISYWAGFIITIIAIMLYQVVTSNATEILEALGLAKTLRADTLESGSGRLVAWAFAWKTINSSVSQFFIGGGWAYEEFLFIANRDFLGRLGHIGGVHNSYLGIWLNTGLIGLILWFYGFFRCIFTAARYSYLAMPLTYAALFSAFIESWLLGSLNPFTIIFISLITYITQVPRTVDDPEPPGSISTSSTVRPLAPQ